MKVFILFLFFIVFTSSIYTIDEIRVVPGQSESDSRHYYPHALLKAALEATLESDGPYIISYAPVTMTRNRALKELLKGKLINVHEAPTREEWEQTVIPIRIPIRKGILGYRVFLINAEDSQKFEKLKTIDELKQLKAGLGSQWSTTLVMKVLDFKIVTGLDYEGLFSMLASRRFDYFPRGINEIFKEFETREKKFSNMRIEQTKALYFITPTYLFVSPEYPELADRIKRGFLTIIENGTFDTLFYKEHDEFIKKAGLDKRMIFRVENPLLSKETPLDQAGFWYNP